MKIDGSTCNRRLSRDIICDGKVGMRRDGYYCNKCGAFQSYSHISHTWVWATPRHILKKMGIEW